MQQIWFLSGTLGYARKENDNDNVDECITYFNCPHELINKYDVNGKDTLAMFIKLIEQHCESKKTHTKTLTFLFIIIQYLSMYLLWITKWIILLNFEKGVYGFFFQY